MGCETRLAEILTCWHHHGIALNGRLLAVGAWQLGRHTVERGIHAGTGKSLAHEMPIIDKRLVSNKTHSYSAVELPYSGVRPTRASSESRCRRFSKGFFSVKYGFVEIAEKGHR